MDLPPLHSPLLFWFRGEVLIFKFFLWFYWVRTSTAGTGAGVIHRGGKQDDKPGWDKDLISMCPGATFKQRGSSKSLTGG